jgi:hypothetical protein
MAATYNKFQDFVEQLCAGKHIINSTTQQLNVTLTNSAPVATNTILSNITQISGTNGYTTNGADTQNTGSETTGTFTLTGTKVVWTCATAPMGPFQYVVLHNETEQTAPVRPLIAWWDYGSAVTLQVGESFSVKFNSSDTTGTILTLA